MRTILRTLLAGLLSLTAIVLVPGPAEAGRGDTVRFATYNASLNRAAAGQLVTDLSTPNNTQARNIAEVLQRTRPDVVLLNEFDYVPGYRAVDLFRRNYLERSQQGAAPIRYRYAFTAPSNTGIPSGFDLDRNGTIGGGNDAYGFGEFPGQYGMVVLSRYPIDRDRIRTFQRFRWADLPGALLPDDPATPQPADWYSDAVLARFRLSSKSHWDVPVRVGRRTVHVLASHPTPPTFDGAEDRNGTRNFDEIRFWAEYVEPQANRWIYDDHGRRGGLRFGARFVIMGDQNSDPLDGDSVEGAIDQLLDSPWIRDPRPSSAGAAEASVLQGGANLTHEGDPRLRHGRLQRQPRPRQPPGRLRPAVVAAPRPERRGLLASPVRPAVSPHGRVPLPDQRSSPRVGGRSGPLTRRMAAYGCFSCVFTAVRCQRTRPTH